jgi:hypothetical protein
VFHHYDKIPARKKTKNEERVISEGFSSLSTESLSLGLKQSRTLCQEEHVGRRLLTSKCQIQRAGKKYIPFRHASSNLLLARPTS